MGYEAIEECWKRASSGDSPLYDDTLAYPGYHGCPSKCRIRLFRVDGAPVVVCTELEENNGTSVTNAAEMIATLVLNTLGRPSALTWVEHYPDRAFFGNKPMMREQFDLVEFEWSGSALLHHPRWRRIPKEEAERLCRSAL